MSQRGKVDGKEERYRADKLSDVGKYRTEPVASILDRFKGSLVTYFEHSERVGQIAAKLAQEIYGRENSMVLDFFTSLGRLHDLGKFAIPQGILEKNGPLTSLEREIVNSHPELGEYMLKNCNECAAMLPAIRHHHEQWDGSGYPDGLSGDGIPFEARIISIADTYDALTSDRPYRKGISSEKALLEIVKCAGAQFDPLLAECFVRMMRIELKAAA